MKTFLNIDAVEKEYLPKYHERKKLDPESIRKEEIWIPVQRERERR